MRGTSKYVSLGSQPNDASSARSALGLRVVDEPRLQLGEQRREFLDRHVELRGLRIDRAERLGDQAAGVLDERQRLRRRRIDQHLPAVEARTPLVIGDFGSEDTVVIPSSAFRQRHIGNEIVAVDLPSACRAREPRADLGQQIGSVNSTRSGLAARSSSGDTIGMSVPGIRLPCLAGEASATAGAT